MKKRLTSLGLFKLLVWIDSTPLLDHIEPYRRRIFSTVLDDVDPTTGRVKFNLALMGRGKKNHKSADLVLASLFALVGNNSPGGNQVFTLANDQDQAADDLQLAKLLVAANPLLQDEVQVKNKEIVRKDGKGEWLILPAQDAVGCHGKTYRLCGFDELHGHRNWDVLEAMQHDPTRPDAQMWITSYASIHHRPGVPLFDLTALGKAGTDPRMYFSWYAADFCNDPDFETLDPEGRANPSKASWGNDDYLEQQKRRLPAHKYRRLHLNLPGAPEGSAYQAESVMDAVVRRVTEREPMVGRVYHAFVDMSGGSNDDSCLAIAHKEDEKVILDLVVNQGPPPPFDPLKAVEKFTPLIKQYGLLTATADNYAGETFKAAFQKHGIKIKVSEATKSELYEALESPLNGHRVVLLDVPVLEQQMLGLVWRGSKIDHPSGEHDDWANAAAGALTLAGGAQKESAGIVVLHNPQLPSGVKRFIDQRNDSAGWARFGRKEAPAMRDPRFS